MDINLNKAAQLIKDGKVVAFPTETVYGLGANAFDPDAVARIFELKERPSFDPLIVHISHLDQLNELTEIKDSRVHMLAERFWPGPLTMVLPKHQNVPDIVTSGLPTVGIRMPANKTALDLISLSGCPVAAPSANKFGRISPTTAAHVKKQLSEADFILDVGKATIGIESTIIRLTNYGFKILRNGFITKEEIEEILPFDNSMQSENLVAPGMLKSHYSPDKKFLILDNIDHTTDKSKAGLISFTGAYEKYFSKVIKVSERNDLKDYAVNMFDAMHQFEDDQSVEVIFAEPVEEKGIGIAIMDRLRKAEYNWQQ